MEIQIDEICLKDPIASEVFKHLYKYKYKQGDEVPPIIKGLIKLIKLADMTKTGKNKTAIKLRLNNIAVVGVIRFYHLERRPYLYPSQINKAINFFRNALLVIDKIEGGSIKDGEIVGELPIFDAFRDDKKKK